MACRLCRLSWAWPRRWRSRSGPPSATLGPRLCDEQRNVVREAVARGCSQPLSRRQRSQYGPSSAERRSQIYEQRVELRSVAVRGSSHPWSRRSRPSPLEGQCCPCEQRSILRAEAARGCQWRWPRRTPRSAPWRGALGRRRRPVAPTVAARRGLRFRPWCRRRRSGHPLSWHPRGGGRGRRRLDVEPAGHRQRSGQPRRGGRRPRARRQRRAPGAPRASRRGRRRRAQRLGCRGDPHSGGIRCVSAGALRGAAGSSGKGALRAEGQGGARRGGVPGGRPPR
mmetsp:Transcript_47165/g.151363  ORF Transcript_47165/g.151363 Transcript_47165/m.151363 type:complete len:282 (-) Transcript_47165:98-943(-)